MKEMRGRYRRRLKVIDLVYEIDDCEQMLNKIFTELRRLLAYSNDVLLPVDPGTRELREAVCFNCLYICQRGFPAAASAGRRPIVDGLA